MIPLLLIIAKICLFHHSIFPVSFYYLRFTVNRFTGLLLACFLSFYIYRCELGLAKVSSRSPITSTGVGFEPTTFGLVLLRSTNWSFSIFAISAGLVSSSALSRFLSVCHSLIISLPCPCHVYVRPSAQVFPQNWLRIVFWWRYFILIIPRNHRSQILEKLVDCF